MAEITGWQVHRLRSPYSTTMNCYLFTQEFLRIFYLFVTYYFLHLLSLTLVQWLGHRVNRVSGSLGHKMWPGFMSAKHVYTFQRIETVIRGRFPIFINISVLFRAFPIFALTAESLRVRLGYTRHRCTVYFDVRTPFLIGQLVYILWVEWGVIFLDWGRL